MAEKKIYHVFNRGVEKRDIFLEDVDRVRFIHDMFEFNDCNPAPKYLSNGEVENQKERDSLVTIYAFCLMPNHYHLLLEEINDGSMSLFAKKLQGGYARAFNEKHKRSGYLFQGKYKKIPISTDRQLFQVACYIHANPLDLWKFKWKEEGLKKEEMKEALNFLDNYRWSSHIDYLGKKNFSSIINKRLLTGIFNENVDYEKCFKEWLEFFENNIQEIKQLINE